MVIEILHGLEQCAFTTGKSAKKLKSFVFMKMSKSDKKPFPEFDIFPIYFRIFGFSDLFFVLLSLLKKYHVIVFEGFPD